VLLYVEIERLREILSYKVEKISELNKLAALQTSVPEKDKNKFENL